MLWQIVLVGVVCRLVVMWWRTRRLREVAKQLRSDLPRLPLIGDTHHFIGDGEVRMSVIQEFGRQAMKYGGWTSVQLGNKFYGMVADGEDAEYILKTHLEKDDILKMTRILIGNGLIFAPVPIWRPRRKVLAPTFSQHNLNQFVDVFYQQSCVMVDELTKQAGRGAFSFWKYVTSYSMDSACLTTLGIDLGTQRSTDNKFMKDFQQFADLTAKRFFYPWLHSDTGFKYLSYFGMYSMIMKCADYLKGFVIDIIEKKRISMKESVQNGGLNNNDEDKKLAFKPILELLIEASGGEKGYTNNELQEEAQVVLVAGTDTSAVGAGFIAMMLAKHPDVQEKAYKEIHDMYGDSDRPIRAEDLSHLTYLEAVVKESVRLYPPVPVTARKILKEDVTPAGVQLTPGMGVVVCMWAIHRNPKHWGKDADEFRPERFFDSPPTHPSAFIPFSSGPRNCLGYKYAMMSMMTATATLLRRYKILPRSPEELNKPLRVSFEIMMKHVDNFELKLECRK